MPKEGAGKLNQVTPTNGAEPALGKTVDAKKASIAQPQVFKIKPKGVVPPKKKSQGPSKSKAPPRASRSEVPSTFSELESRTKKVPHSGKPLFQKKEPVLSEAFVKKKRERALSDAFVSVYPRRWEIDKDSIGTNPVSQLSVFQKSRLGLDISHFLSEKDIITGESDLEYLRRRMREFCQACCILPTISCFLCCRSIFMNNYQDNELELLFQPRTHHSTQYLKKIKITLEGLPERDWKGGLVENILEALTNSIVSAEHMEHLDLLMTQFRTTLAFSNLYASTPITPIVPDLLQGRSMSASFLYMITFMLTELDTMDEHYHHSTMRYIRKLFLELVTESVMLWSSVCHIANTAEIVMEDYERVIGKYLFNIRSGKAEVVNLRAKADYIEQARVRLILRREKKLKDSKIMDHKIKWPMTIRAPTKPDLVVVSRNEETNVQWHPTSSFNFPAQTSIIVNLIQRTKAILADAFSLLTEFDQTLHTHRPSRKQPHTLTLFEDVIYLKDRCMELNTFPRNILNEQEVEWLYEVGRVLSDKLDELYISLFAAKDVARETIHVAQLCHEFLRIHEHWDMENFHFLAKTIQDDCHKDWDHFEGFGGLEVIHSLEDPIPLFYASIYPTLIRMFPVKVARIFLSFQSPEELKLRKEPSSHSLWDAFDVVPAPQHVYSKQEAFVRNK